MELLPLTTEHWPRVREIYLEGIAGGHATFETTAPSWEEWDAAHHAFARLVASIGGRIHGWAALSRVSARQAYRGVAEVSVYVAKSSQGRGYGRALLASLITESERNGIWTLQASIFPENLPSLALHEAAGFRVVGQRDRIARLQGVWRNTMLLERRSFVVGTE
jgi:phosphinothricin acetyltransferase